jgi:hypothetical protein
MTIDLDAARRLLAAATSERDATDERLRAALHDDVTLASPIGEQHGPDAVLAGLATTRELFASGTWSEQLAGDDEVRFTGAFPPGSPLAAAELRLHFDDRGRIDEIRERLSPAGPPPPVPVDLRPFAVAIDGALDNGTPVVAAYVDGDGQPQLSFRGTVQVLDRARLALWIRDANGGLPRALATNPRLAFWYHDRSTRATYQFQGRGRVETDPATRDVVFEGSPTREQQFDPDRSGVAVVVDIDVVTGRGPDGPVNMRRDAQP